MKFGIRVPSLKKRISARTSWKRYGRHSMGIKMPKGYGIFTNPKKAVYNKIHRKTTLGIGDILKMGRTGKKKLVQDIERTSRSPANQLILDRHFQLSEMIPLLYKERESEGLNKTITACKQQIELSEKVRKILSERYPEQSFPSHGGYEKLVIILDKQNRHNEAIKICRQAKREGWSGNWDERIQRYTSKLS